jgi:hypothetical protein
MSVLHRRLRALVGLVVPLATSGVAAAEVELPEWTKHVRLSGSADVGYFGGGSGSVQTSEGFDVWDTRFFVDAELGDAVTVGDTTLVRNLGFTFEWNLVRTGRLFNDVGLAYLDLEGLGGSPWLNLRVGRFQIPFGEAYKLYTKGYAKRTFVRQPLAAPWWWDEGVLLHGGAPNGRFGYVASFTNGDSDFNDQGGGSQLTLKLWTQPWPCLYVSASGLWTSEMGDVDAALWLGESWARPFGSGTAVPNVIDGAVVADDPDGLGSLWAATMDVIVTPVDGVRLWLYGGHYVIDSRGAALYDRELTFWLAELTLGGELVSPVVQPLFVGLRADGVSTFDHDRGYLFDRRYDDRLGYDMERFVAYTVVAGWHFGDYVTFRAEYSHRDIDVVGGASALLPSAGDDEDVFAVEFGLHF